MRPARRATRSATRSISTLQDRPKRRRSAGLTQVKRRGGCASYSGSTGDRPAATAPSSSRSLHEIDPFVIPALRCRRRRVRAVPVRRRDRRGAGRVRADRRPGPRIGRRCDRSGRHPRRRPAAPHPALTAVADAASDFRRPAMASRPTLQVIYDEHGALSAVLRSIGLLLSEHRRRGDLPDFAVLRAMLFYIDEFPERIHHTKESELLFPRIRARSAEAADVLDRLDADHAHSALAVRELEHELLAVEMMHEGPDGDTRRAHFEHAMDAYITGYLEHIRTEERVVLPL